MTRGARHVFAAVLLAALALVARAAPEDLLEPAARTPGSRNLAVVLAGAGAADEYRQRFADIALTLREVLLTEYGYREDDVRALIGNGERASFESCTRENLERLIAALKSAVRPDDQVTFFLVGHGTGAGRDARFNLVGPDVTAREMAELLAPLQRQRVIVIDTTSASFPFLDPLRGKGVLLLSATRSAVERYDTQFPGYLLEALEGHAADRDKNGRVSVAELFLFTREKVTAHFQDAGRLATEHAVLDDGAQGRMAEVAFIDAEREEFAELAPEVQVLARRARDLERQVILLRGRKAEFPSGVYYDRLEETLVELARTMREIRDR